MDASARIPIGPQPEQRSKALSPKTLSYASETIAACIEQYSDAQLAVLTGALNDEGLTWHSLAQIAEERAADVVEKMQLVVTNAAESAAQRFSPATEQLVRQARRALYTSVNQA